MPARQGEHGEARSSAEAIQPTQVVVGEETAEREGCREGEGPARTGDSPYEPDLDPPAHRERHDAREQPDRGVVGLPLRPCASEPAWDEVRERVHERAVEK